MTLTVPLWVIPLAISLICISISFIKGENSGGGFGFDFEPLLWFVAGIFVWFLYFTILYFLR